MRSGVIGQAIKKNIIEFESVNPRFFTKDKHKTVDDVPYGGGDGMLMLAEVLEKSLQSILEPAQKSNQKVKTVYLSPQGRLFRQELITDFLNYDQINFVCGRYAGVDNRFVIKNNISEYSLGDYVLSGGELPALSMMDAIARKIPGVLGNQESSELDSFYEGLLEAPSFTRPGEWQGLDVPSVLISGHHARIKEWKEFMSVLVTLKKRPELLLYTQSKSAILLPSGRRISLIDVEAFYSSLSDKEKIVCGIQDMVIRGDEN